MEKIDRDGLLLCRMQAETFEMTVSRVSTSSEIFIRRFMNSRAARLLDTGAVLETGLRPCDLLKMIEEQYGSSRYGSVRYSTEEMYWIGYIYRYFAYTQKRTSLQVYKAIRPKELRGLYLPYHSLDPALAVERIMEAKHQILNEEDEVRRQYEILKKNYRPILQEVTVGWSGTPTDTDISSP